MDTVSLLIVLGSVVFCLVLWLGISFLSGGMSGWRKLASLYPDAVPSQPGEKKRRVSAKLGRTRYNGVLVLEALPTGLRLRTVWLFRFGHSPIVIPWSEISLPEKIITKKWGSMYTHQIIVQKAAYPIMVTAEAAEWIKEKRQKFGG